MGFFKKFSIDCGGDIAYTNITINRGSDSTALVDKLLSQSIIIPSNVTDYISIETVDVNNNRVSMDWDVSGPAISGSMSSGYKTGQLVRTLPSNTLQNIGYSFSDSWSYRDSAHIPVYAWNPSINLSGLTAYRSDNAGNASLNGDCITISVSSLASLTNKAYMQGKNADIVTSYNCKVRYNISLTGSMTETFNYDDDYLIDTAAYINLYKNGKTYTKTFAPTGSDFSNVIVSVTAQIDGTAPTDCIDTMAESTTVTGKLTVAYFMCLPNDGSGLGIGGNPSHGNVASPTFEVLWEMFINNLNSSGAIKQNGTPVSLNGHTHSLLTNTGAVQLQGNSGHATPDRMRIIVDKHHLSAGDMGTLRPDYMDGSTSYTNLGSGTYYWRNVYAKNGTIQTSDRNQKREITDLPNKYLQLFDLLRPVSFKFTEGDRVHLGFIAQEVEDAMTQLGITEGQFSGLCKDLDDDGNTIYGLRYDQFIAMQSAKIKQLEDRLEALEDKLERKE